MEVSLCGSGFSRESPQLSGSPSLWERLRPGIPSSLSHSQQSRTTLPFVICHPRSLGNMTITRSSQSGIAHAYGGATSAAQRSLIACWVGVHDHDVDARAGGVVSRSERRSSTRRRELIMAEHIGLATTLAYVVMPDHLHWLMVLGSKATLAETMRRVKGRSARAMNLMLCRRGTIWESAFHDRAVRSDEDLRRLAIYLIYNPIRAGIAERLEDYPLWDARWM